MKNITNNKMTRQHNGGGVVSSFVIGFVLKKVVVGIYNYYYDKGQGRWVYCSPNF